MSSSKASLHFMQEALTLSDVPITIYTMFKVSDFNTSPLFKCCNTKARLDYTRLES